MQSNQVNLASIYTHCDSVLTALGYMGNEYVFSLNRTIGIYSPYTQVEILSPGVTYILVDRKDNRNKQQVTYYGYDAEQPDKLRQFLTSDVYTLDGQLVFDRMTNYSLRRTHTPLTSKLVLSLLELIIRMELPERYQIHTLPGILESTLNDIHQEMIKDYGYRYTLRDITAHTNYLITEIDKRILEKDNQVNQFANYTNYPVYNFLMDLIYQLTEVIKSTTENLSYHVYDITTKDDYVTIRFNEDYRIAEWTEVYDPQSIDKPIVSSLFRTSRE